MQEEERFLQLKKRHLHNLEIKKQREIRRKERERKRKAKEELKRARLKAQQEADESAKRAKEKEEKVQQALDKFNRLKDLDSLSDCEQSDESDEGLGEEEENSLLAENENQLGEIRMDEEKPKDSDNSDTSENQRDTNIEQDNEPSLNKDSSGDDSNHSVCEKTELGDKDKDGHGIESEPAAKDVTENPIPIESVSGENFTEKERTTLESEKETGCTAEELWLEAVGGCGQGEITIPEDDCDLSPESANSDPLPGDSDKSRKRRRSSEEDFYDDDEEDKPSKVAKLDEEEVERIIKLFNKDSQKANQEDEHQDEIESEDESDVEDSTDETIDEDEIQYKKVRS